VNVPLGASVILEDAGPQAYSLASTFTDVDGDPLTLTVQSFTNPGLFSSPPSISGNNLVFTTAPNANGGSSIVVQATDPSNASVRSTKTLRVTPVNDPPTFVSGPGAITFAEDSGAHAVSLAGNFTDVDGDPLTYTVTSVSNAALFSSAPSMSGTTLNFTSAPNKNGNSTVRVRAQDTSGAFAAHDYLVQITPVNDAPTANVVAPVNVAEDAGPQSISVAGAFSDVDVATNADTLTYSIVSFTNASLFSTPPALSGTNLTFTSAPNFNGASTITLKATDSGGASVNNTVSLTVTPTNDAPIVVGSAGPVNVNEDAPPVAVDLSGVFSDPDVGHEGD